ncbi:hypothetical protein [Armatimonas sp.]|uniref:hypothetical protein n=1 Tax=Armatimonas sp. TaxID=1872638 RepID=UPI00286BF1B1|nr:hypothetical protein [Armatimonas sp.]
MRHFAEEFLAPQAALLDTDPDAMRAVWQAFVARGLHQELDFFTTLPLLTEYSGAFAFLALQQRVAGCPDVPAGVAFGHLRNPQGPAPLWSEGRVSGTVPWLTGAGIFTRVLLGFRLTDGSEVRAWVEAQDRPEFRHSAPLPLLAIRGSNTVSVALNNLDIPESAFVSVQPLGTQSQSDAKGVLYQTPLMLGNLHASLRLIEASGRGALAKAYAIVAQLEVELRAENAAQNGPALRARAGDLSVRLARLACMACGGGSLVTGHPAERVYREALVFSLMAQTDAIVNDAFEELL